jgi:2,4-dienoyl-CoA reductase-like NADH-dependent reductase (Old Yellow Enzyme family)
MPYRVLSSTVTSAAVYAARPSKCEQVRNTALYCVSVPLSFISAPFKLLARHAPKECFSWPVSLLSVPVQAVTAPIIKSLFKSAASDAQPVEYAKYKTDKSDATNLSSTVSLRNGVKLSHRIIKAGITDGLCTLEGNPTLEMIRLYERYAAGGYSMIISPDTTVDRRSRLPGTTGHTPIFDPQSNRQSFQELAQAMKKGGSLAVLQLTHPGHVVPFADRAYAPSIYTASSPRSGLPQFTYELTTEQVDQIIGMFLTSARQAEEWGFDGIQLVASNGYLPAAFLNPNLNTRTDKWAKDAFVLTLVEALLNQRKNSKFVIGLKINSADLQAAQLTPKQSIALVETISALQPDFIEIGGGNCEQVLNGSLRPENEKNGSSPAKVAESTLRREAFFHPFAVGILQSKKIRSPIMATGDWRSLSIMNATAQKYPNLLLGLGRPTCLDPAIGNKLLGAHVSLIPDWFREYLPPFVKEELEKNPAEGGKMAFGVEMMWHALAVGSMAFGEEVPRVAKIFEKPEHAFAARIHMLIRAVTVRKLLLSYFREHPFAANPKKEAK